MCGVKMRISCMCLEFDDVLGKSYLVVARFGSAWGDDESSGSAKMFDPCYDWFKHFKKCTNLFKICLVGEGVGAASKCGGRQFPKELKQITVKRGYSPKQVFCVDEMVLFWKRMPPHTSISKNGKCSLLRSSQSQSCSSPPRHYHREKPRALFIVNLSW